MKRNVWLQKGICYALVFALVAVGTLWVKPMQTQAAESFKKVINVTSKKYGAKSGKDSTKAIQKALDEAGEKATNSKRVQVVIPKGRFYIDRTLKISSNTYLKCEKGAKIVKKSKNCLFMLKGKNSGKVGSYNDLSNITVDGGLWDAKYIQRNKESGGALMYFTHSNNLTIKNATLCHVFGSHLIEVGASDKVKISNCELYGYKRSKDGGDKEAIQLDISHNSDIEPDAAPYDDTACTNVILEKNKIHDYARGIGSHSAVKGVCHKNITIRNNNIYNITAEGIYICNYYNTVITKNKLTNVGAGVVVKGFNPTIDTMFEKRRPGAIVTKLDNNNYKIEISNNTIKTKNKSVSSDSGQIGVYVVANEDYPVNGCIIKNNTLKTASNGVLLKYAGNSEVLSNKITRLNNSSGKAIKYTVDAIGIVSSSNNEVRKNRVNYSKKNKFDSGIGVRDKSINNCLEGNQLSYLKDNGIKLAGASSANILHNNIKSTVSDGIALYDKSSAKLSGNTIKSSGRHGIFVYDSSSLTMDSTAQKLSVSDSKQHGISGSDKAKIVLEKVEIKNSGKYGVFAYNNANISVKKGKILNSSDSGVCANKAKIDLSGTTVNGSKKYGVAVTNNSTGNLVSCTISNNKRTGVYISKSKSEKLSNNKIMNNKGRGMDITGSTVKSITNNAFSNPNASYELRVYSSNVPDGIGNLQEPGDKDDFGNYVFKD